MTRSDPVQRPPAPSLRDRLRAVRYHGPGFDLLRLIAASVVVLHHSLDFNFDKVQIDPLYRAGHHHYHIGLLAVAAFFAMSGFLVSPGLTRSGNVVEFALKRALRILPLLATVVVVTILLVGPVLTTLPLGAYFADGDTHRYVANVLTSMHRYLPGVVAPSGESMTVNGALWTLRYEVQAYGLLAVFSLLGVLRFRWLFLGVVAVAYGLATASHLAPDQVAAIPGRVVIFAELFSYFGAGVALFLFSEVIPFSRTAAVGAVAVAGGSLLLGLAPLVMPFCLAYGVVVFGLSDLPLRGPLAGYDLSYGIYLTHGPIELLVAALLPGPKRWWVIFLISLALSGLIASVTWRMIEHPALRQKARLAEIVARQVQRLGRIIPLARRLNGVAAGPVEVERAI